MKKIILMTAVLVTSMMTAQVIEVEGHPGEEITNGYVFITNTLIGSEGADLPLHVTNVTDSDIYVKLRMDEVVNAANMDWMDPEIGGVQFCFGALCFFEVEEGDIVPSGIDAALITPGGQNQAGDHFVNNYGGDTAGQPVEYHMSLVQYNADGTPMDQAPLLSFTYKYVPTADVTDFNNLHNIGINIKNTVVKNTFDVDTTITAKMELFDVTGKQVLNIAVANGTNAIDLSGLNAAVYIARFTTEDNKTAQIRIVKN